jgi:hypothetical protein
MTGCALGKAISFRMFSTFLAESDPNSDLCAFAHCRDAASYETHCRGEGVQTLR